MALHQICHSTCTVQCCPTMTSSRSYVLLVGLVLLMSYLQDWLCLPDTYIVHTRVANHKSNAPHPIIVIAETHCGSVVRSEAKMENASTWLSQCAAYRQMSFTASTHPLLKDDVARTYLHRSTCMMSPSGLDMLTAGILDPRPVVHAHHVTADTFQCFLNNGQSCQKTITKMVDISHSWQHHCQQAIVSKASLQQLAQQQQQAHMTQQKTGHLDHCT